MDAHETTGDSGFTIGTGVFQNVNFLAHHSADGDDIRNVEGIFQEDRHKLNGLSLTWKDLSVSLLCRKDKLFGFVKRSFFKKIVENVSGAVEPGNLVALMGPSGAGKSTILSALARRTPGNILIDGDVRLNGVPVDDSIRKVTGYMYQEDYFVSVLTVKEHLRYMARLKMDRRVSRRKMEQRITSLLDALSLTSVANSRIGGLASYGEKGILSGGEKKRLSFATACLNLPQLLFVDEPTTGLDSFTANRLVSIMKSMVVSTGASMIATIHQPSPDVLAMFSSIILVSDGRMVFSGTADDGVKFLQGCGYRMSKTITEAEFLLQCVAPTPYLDKSAPSSSYPSPQKIPVRRLAAAFEASDYFNKTQDAIQFYNEEKIPDACFHHAGAFWITQLFWLTIRGMVELGRNPDVQWIRIGQKMLIALTAGACYFGVLQMDQKGIQGIQGVLFLMVTENVFAPMYAVMAVFPKEYPLFIREYRNGTYSPSAYYLSKFLCLGPGAILEAFLFTSLLYSLAGLRFEVYPYVLTTAFSILCINIATACGALFSNAFSSIPMALMYLLPVEYISMITSGMFMKLRLSWGLFLLILLFGYQVLRGNDLLSDEWIGFDWLAIVVLGRLHLFNMAVCGRLILPFNIARVAELWSISTSSLPWTTAWLQYLSWFMYTYESMSVVQWSGVQNISCPAEEALRSACLTDGNQVLDHYDFSEIHLVRNVCSLVAFYVIFQFLGYQCFLRKVKMEL